MNRGKSCVRMRPRAAFSKRLRRMLVWGALLCPMTGFYLFGEEDRLTAERRAAIVDKVAATLNERYIFADVALKMEAYVKQKQGEGAYDSLGDPEAFAARLTEDLREICKDLHLRVRYAPEPPRSRDSAEDREAVRRSMAAQNYGFQKVERLRGNVGYLDLRGFFEASEGGATAVAAMNFLAHVDALIVDLRQNGGGSPSMIQLLSSYFFEEPVHLNSFYIRQGDQTEQYWTSAFVAGPRMADVALYVLTSGRTFSAAEEFAYNLKNLERATLIGETTGGGAHPVDYAYFEELKFGLTVPYGRAINPITGSNWEGSGVSPHIEVPRKDAFDRAYEEALRALLSKAEDGPQKTEIEWVLAEWEAKRLAPEVPLSSLQAYVGTYGPRKLRLVEGRLIYQRDEGPKYPLYPLSEDTFGLEGLDYFRIRVEKDEGGEVVALVGLYSNGNRDRSPKD